jgi:hypothetical protein
MVRLSKSYLVDYFWKVKGQQASKNKETQNIKKVKISEEKAPED